VEAVGDKLGQALSFKIPIPIPFLSPEINVGHLVGGGAMLLRAITACKEKGRLRQLL
jgi:hypothetical protein